MQDRRSEPREGEISPQVHEQATVQLEAEICTLENWLSELDETRSDNPESLAARKSYMDMLESRRQLLNSLQSHQNDNQ